MNILRNLTTPTVLCIALCISTPLYAIQGNPIRFKTLATRNTAFQAALRHAQAAQRLAAEKNVGGMPLGQPRTAEALSRFSSQNIGQKRIILPPSSVEQAVEQFCKTRGYYPRPGMPDERKLYKNASSLVKRLGPEHPISKHILALKKQYPFQKWQDEQYVKELEQFIEKNKYFPTLQDTDQRRLYENTNNLIHRLGPKHPISEHILNLRVQYSRTAWKNEHYLEELKRSIETNGHYPCSQIPEEYNFYLKLNSLMQRLGPKHPISQQILELKEKYSVRQQKNEQHMEELEKFIEDNKYFPRAHAAGERSLYRNITYLLQELGPKHPISQRILKLKEKYPFRKWQDEQYVKELEQFIEENKHYPHDHITQEHETYRNAQKLIYRLGPEHPLSLHVQELKAKKRFRPRTVQTVLANLEDFLQKNNRWPALKISIAENQLFFELEALMENLEPGNPTAEYINQLRAQYAL